MAKKKVQTYCSINELGELKVEKKDLFIENLKTLTGYKCKVTVEKLYDKHSNNQREYYFSVVIPCCKDGIETEWGDFYTTDEVHLLLKENCLYDTRVNESTGEILHIPKSISGLDIVEMIDYIERCIKLIGEFFCIEVPPSNKNWKAYESTL